MKISLHKLLRNKSIKDYDITLRPHHVKNFIVFESEKLFQLSDKEYIDRFREKNKGYHDEEFII